jgi:hypothetical protein
MDVEQLAKEMRFAALEGYKIVTKDDLNIIREDLLKLYFDAGRWAGGARDYPARQAFEAYNAREQRKGKL